VRDEFDEFLNGGGIVIVVVVKALSAEGISAACNPARQSREPGAAIS